MRIDTKRHDALLDYRTALDPIHVIGIGGTGSRIAEQLALFGLGELNEIHIWDPDTVEAHNLPNQAYDKSDVCRLKTDALARHMNRWAGVVPVAHPEAATGASSFSGIVFLCVDSMETGKELVNQCVKGNEKVSLMIETRMDATNGIIHAVDPSNERHMRTWDKYWYPDSAATNLMGCGGHVVIGPSVSCVASLAVWELIRFFAIRGGLDERLNSQIRIGFRPLSIETYQW